MAGHFCFSSGTLTSNLHNVKLTLFPHLNLEYGNPKQTTVKKDIKKEEAEELKAKLEAVGATVDIV